MTASRFQPGQSGNPAGRRLGSRNKLSEGFVEALFADFEAHGVEAIQRTREEKPDVYIRVIASLLPKEIKVEAVSDMTDDQLEARISSLSAALNFGMGNLKPRGNA
jgi:hypothetical protein